MRFHDYPKSLEEHYLRRMRETYRMRAERLAAIDTADKAREHVAWLHGVITDAFEPLPPRTPLNPRVWRITAHEGYHIEHLTFESRPDFLVSANLYLPDHVHARVPGVLFPCGHFPSAKAQPQYYEACVRLVREGYAVLIYDPINQGERELYGAFDTGGRLSREKNWEGHNLIGRQLQACGEWLGTWRLWDGLRALDYLAARSEVDAEQLAVTGHSGGGTLSAYLWAMDCRLRAVASSCWCTSYLHDLENSQPADDEQYPPGFLTAGLDKTDFFLARAGEPTLLLGQEFDFFDDRGLQGGYTELRRLHELLGGDPHFCRLRMDTCTHDFSVGNQLDMLEFFNSVFGKSAPTAQPALPAFTERDLQVTPEHDVCRAGSRPMYALVAEQARRVAASQLPIAADALPALIRETLVVPITEEIPYYRRFFQTTVARLTTGQYIHRFAIETDAELYCVLRHICREAAPYRLNPRAQTVLYLPNIDSQQELDHPETMAGVDDFWMLDVRGLGEGLFTIDDPYMLCGHDSMLSGHALLYNETLLGSRVGDVLSAIRLLRAEGAREIQLAGRKQGAVLALLAGVLDPTIAGVASHEAPESFLALSAAPVTFWPAVNFPRGVLSTFDLPAVRDALRARLVVDTISSPVEFAEAGQQV